MTVAVIIIGIHCHDKQLFRIAQILYFAFPFGSLFYKLNDATNVYSNNIDDLKTNYKIEWTIYSRITKMYCKK